MRFWILEEPSLFFFASFIVKKNIYHIDFTCESLYVRQIWKTQRKSICDESRKKTRCSAQGIFSTSTVEMLLWNFLQFQNGHEPKAKNLFKEICQQFFLYENIMCKLKISKKSKQRETHDSTRKPIVVPLYLVLFYFILWL